MRAWRRICCPVDLSAASRPALEQAAGLAVLLRAELLLLHVRPDGPAAPLLGPPPRAHGAEPSERFDAWVADARRLAPGLVNSIELSGDAARQIVQTVQEFDCDVVVMGTHGRTGLVHRAMGSVTEHVVRDAPCPVLVVRHPPPG